MMFLTEPIAVIISTIMMKEKNSCTPLFLQEPQGILQASIVEYKTLSLTFKMTITSVSRKTIYVLGASTECCSGRIRLSQRNY